MAMSSKFSRRPTNTKPPRVCRKPPPIEIPPLPPWTPKTAPKTKLQLQFNVSYKLAPMQFRNRYWCRSDLPWQPPDHAYVYEREIEAHDLCVTLHQWEFDPYFYDLTLVYWRAGTFETQKVWSPIRIPDIRTYDSGHLTWTYIDYQGRTCYADLRVTE